MSHGKVKHLMIPCGIVFKQYYQEKSLTSMPIIVVEPNVYGKSF